MRATSLTRWQPAMRAGDDAPTATRDDRVRLGRMVREKHDAIVLWREDLNALQLGALDALADQVLGRRQGR